MSRASGVVEINGNRYDAASGQVIGSVKKSAHQLKSSAGGVVDGIIRQSSHVALKKRSAAAHVSHTAQTFHKTTQRSKTLMRSAVRKPEIKKDHPHVVSHTVPAETKRHLGKHSSRPHSIARHKKINRFGHVHKLQEVQAQPTRGELVTRTPNSKSAAVTSPSLIASATHSHIERLLDEALSAKSKHAVSRRPRSAHSAWHRIKIMPKWLSLGFASFIIALSAAFFAWQNVPQAAVKVASARAGFTASAPAYTPEGYRFVAPVSYSKGEVALRYQSGSGEGYLITQQPSKLDSTTLGSSVLADQANVQTSQVKGNTVYIYGEKNDATWVNNGVRYTIADQAGLDSEQILRIAGSL